MSLRQALLVTLLDGKASGYELAKRFDVRVASFWHAQPPQLYAELGRMEQEGLVHGHTVEQERRPNKRLFTLTDAGELELVRWLHEPSRLNATKDELLVRMAAIDRMELPAARSAVEERRAHVATKLATYEQMAALLLRGRSEDDFLRTAQRIGPYLTLRRGIAYETSRLEWCDWTLSAIDLRAASKVGSTRRGSTGQSLPAGATVS